jgi:hypothetical protein
VLEVNWVIGCALYSLVPAALIASLIVLMDHPLIAHHMSERLRGIMAMSLASAGLVAASIYGLVLGLSTTPEHWRDPRYFDDITPLIRSLGWLGMLIIALSGTFALRRIWFYLKSVVSFEEKN